MSGVKGKSGRPKGYPKSGGRRPGSPNKRTILVKTAIMEAFSLMGDVPALTEWAKAHQTEFYTLLWVKILPTQFTVKGDPNAPIEHQHQHNIDWTQVPLEVRKQLVELRRQLPVVRIGNGTDAV